MGAAQLFGTLFDADDATPIQTTSEWIRIFFFPICTMIGLIIAIIKRKLLGSLIIIFSMIGLYVIRPDVLTQPVIVGLAFPAILFFIYWLLFRDQKVDW